MMNNSLKSILALSAHRFLPDDLPFEISASPIRRGQMPQTHRCLALDTVPSYG
jgi:hypothetical protein